MHHMRYALCLHGIIIHILTYMMVYLFEHYIDMQSIKMQSIYTSFSIQTINIYSSTIYNRRPYIDCLSIENICIFLIILLSKPIKV